MPRDEDNELREGVTTVPPPAGEDDPYGAPTRVALVPDTILDELMRAREATRAATTRAQATVADAASNDLSALAAAASHVVVPPRPKAPPLPARGKPPAASSPVDAIPCLHDDDVAGEDTLELASRPTAPVPSHMQSGRTVPLSAGLLADVLKGVEERRAAAAAAAGPAAPAPSGQPTKLEAPGRKPRSVLALALVLAVGFSVFITGVVMFLGALE